MAIIRLDPPQQLSTLNGPDLSWMNGKDLDVVAENGRGAWARQQRGQSSPSSGRIPLNWIFHCVVVIDSKTKQRACPGTLLFRIPPPRPFISNDKHE
eukprot:scaffold3011_cov130-Skeletonema_marinoi.AAC.12